MALRCHVFCRFRIHFVLEQKEFLIKMIQGWPLVFSIGLLAHALKRGLFRILHQAVLVASIMKSPADANGTDGVQTICVLNDLEFNGYLLGGDTF